MNVTELARRLKVPTKELLETLPELGFDIGKRAIKVDDRLVDKIIRAWSERKRRASMSEQEAKIKEVKLGDKDEKAADAPVVKIPDTIVVREYAEILQVPVNKLMIELMKNGIMATLNQAIDFETANIIGEDLGFKIERLSAEEKEAAAAVGQDLKLKEIIRQRAATTDRPPVVIVMGHVDHGKTTVLDALRETNVIGSESGGITQHIGAYQVELNGRIITFLDTPGHEAFKAMRSRGSKVADVAVIVVAADDGLQPQTIEVITLCQKENIPFIIAINKVDKETADIDRVKTELAEINLSPEDWGGKTICVPISAKKKENLDSLLEMILLVADVEELKADPEGLAAGTIIETHKDKNEGPVATVLVQTGTLRLGNLVVVGDVTGKIKAIKDEYDKNYDSAPPGKPVKILGLKNTPEVGDVLEVVDDIRLIKQKHKHKHMSSGSTITGASSDDEAEIPTLPLILRTDVVGSQEAIIEALSKLNSDKTRAKIIKKGLGYITDVDIMEAENSGAMLIGFHAKPSKSAEQLARDKKITIHQYEIIYKLLEEVKTELDKIKTQQTTRVELGQIKVLAIFKTAKDHMIVGGEVTKGKVTPNTVVKVVRNGETQDLGKLAELQSSKEIVTEVAAGQQCGLRYNGRPIIEVGDTLEVYQEKTE
ncbi:MAG: translation initiation factor IF-2 [Candidatus Komeilibacteria bacterium]|nr:translation initiation factor IF-2 [Candidatus Komeilibacteria bacterium]